MPNKPYENFYLQNEIEDQFNSYLDLARFFRVNNELEGQPGMKVVVNRYKATDGTEVVAEGEGNTKTIEANYDSVEYVIKTAQNRFSYFDEQLMKDPIMVDTGIRHMATDMFNHENKDIYDELAKATLTVDTALGFDAFVDAVAKLELETLEGVEIFAFVNPANEGKLRKVLKDTLQYVEAFARTGYIGTVAGVNVYTKKDAGDDAVYVATKDAVTLYNKQGTTVEQERDANIRKNTIYSRKYYIAALTDETKVVKINVA